MDSFKQIRNQSRQDKEDSTQNNTITYTVHGSNHSNVMQISSSNVDPYDDAAYNQLFPQVPKLLDFDYNSRITYDQLPEIIPNLQNYYSQYMNPALIAPPYHLAAASNPNLFAEDKKRISWDGDRQHKFYQVVQKLGGLHEATALKIFKDMKDPDLNLGSVSSHLQHERDIAGIKSKRSTTDDEDSGLKTNRKKRRVKRQSSLWTPNLQNKFVSAVQKLGGIKNATANEILKEMHEPTLTRKQVNSHLQNYKKTLRVENKDTAANDTKERASNMNNSTDDDKEFAVIKDEEHNQLLECSKKRRIIIIEDDGKTNEIQECCCPNVGKPDRASIRDETAKDMNNLTDDDLDEIFRNLENVVNLEEDEERDHHSISNKDQNNVNIIEEEHGHHSESNKDRVMIFEDDEREDEIQECCPNDGKPDRAPTREETAKDTNDLTDLDEIFGNLENIVILEEEEEEGDHHSISNKDQNIVNIDEEHGHHLESNKDRIMIFEDDEGEGGMEECPNDWVNDEK